MSRVWRKSCPRLVKEFQSQVLSGEKILYLLRQSGPTGYVLQEGDRKEPLKVYLGEKHSCSCKHFSDFKDLCFHITWVLLKKLKFKSSDPLSHQTGLTYRELSDVFSQADEPIPRVLQTRKNRSRSIGSGRNSEGADSVAKRIVEPGDTCPICLDEMRQGKEVQIVHCRYGCGRGVHLGCIRVLRSHQEMPGGVIICPLCRGIFCQKACELPIPRPPIRLQEPQAATSSPVAAVHRDQECKICFGGPPLTGTIFKCLQCPQVVVCRNCLEGKNFKKLHFGHRLGIRKFANDHWKPLLDDQNEPVRADFRSDRITLPQIRSTTLNRRSVSTGRVREIKHSSSNHELPPLPGLTVGNFSFRQRLA